MKPVANWTSHQMWLDATRGMSGPLSAPVPGWLQSGMDANAVIDGSPLIGSAPNALATSSIFLVQFEQARPCHTSFLERQQ